MPINNTSRTAGPFTCNGVTTTFPFPFKIFDRTDLLVAITVTATGVETALKLDADYTVTLNQGQDSNPGGAVTIGVAPAAGTTLAMTSNIPVTQTLDLTNQGGFYPSVISTALDRIVVQVQQLSARVGLGSLNVGAAASVASVLSFISSLAASAGAAGVGFIQSGLGAILLTIQDVLRERVTVLQYGAVANGVTDDGPAYNRAILDVAKRGGGVVRGRVGTSKIVTSILLPSNVKLDLRNCTLTGNGSNTLIRAAALVNSNLVDITTEYGTQAQGAGTNFVGNAKIEGGMLANAACGIRAHRFNYGTTVEHVVFAASLTNAWISSHSWGLKVHQNTVYAPAIMKDFVDWTEVSGNSFEGPGVTNATTALSITTGGYGGSYSARFASNGFHHWGKGIEFTCEATNAVVETNHFEDTKYHVLGSAQTCQKFRIRNNWMKANLSPSGGGVIAIIFPSLWDSEVGPNFYSDDGASTFDAYVSLTTSNSFGNTIPLPYSPPGTLDISKYQVNDVNTFVLRGGSNDPSKTQPTIETFTGSGYTVEKYKSRYHDIANQIPYCTTTYNAGVLTIDTWIACTAYGVKKRVMFDFFINGANSYMITGVIGALVVKTDINQDYFGGTAAPLVAAASNNNGALRITITGAPAVGNITGWVKEL